MQSDDSAVVVRMPADLHYAVKARAKAENRSMAATIRLALELYVRGKYRRNDGGK